VRQHASRGALLACAVLASCASSTDGGATTMRTDVCVVGGGSAGIGAAVGAARAGADVVLVEKLGRLGGTSANAYVNNWEPGPDCPLVREIYGRMSKIPDAVAIVADHNPDRKLGPFGLWLPKPGSRYEQTLERSGRPRSDWRACTWEPDAFHQVVTTMLAETRRCRVLLRTAFTEADADGRRVRAIRAEAADGTAFRIEANVFIDCTGGGFLCRAVGCEAMLGPDPRSRFNEPFAPDEPGPMLNAISLCYRIRRAERPRRQAPPDPMPRGWQRVAHVSGLPCGDRIVNPLALIPGRMLVERGYDATMAEGRRRVQAHWHWLQGHEAFAGFELHSIAPMLGIRESYRILGQHVLTQHDLMAGLSRQKHADIIAIADHSMDVHGSGGRRIRGELKQPYGIPFRCLIPKGWANLMVAGRCASFSQIAASSCRLNRTMTALGLAAGCGAAQAAASGRPVAEVDVTAFQPSLGLPASAAHPGH